MIGRDVYIEGILNDLAILRARVRELEAFRQAANDLLLEAPSLPTVYVAARRLEEMFREEVNSEPADR